MAEKVLMGSFGENLRREREMRGVTLEEISAATKISVRFLRSIEGEDFSKLPGGIFSRSFIRAYARYLGLDEEPLIAEYQLASQGKDDVDLARLSLQAPHSSRDRRPRSAWVGVAVAVVLLVAGYGLWRHSQASRESVPPKTGPISTSVPAPGAATGSSAHMASPMQSPEAAVTPGGSSGQMAQTAPSGQAPANAGAGNGLVLRIAATEQAWVAVDADGKTILQGVMEPHEAKTLRAQNSFDVLTGNARGVILTLNGHTLKPLGREGEVKSIHLTRDDLKNFKSP